MKKIQYSYLPAANETAGGVAKNKTAHKSTAGKNVTPPNEETIARLNAIAREYPFCAYMKQKGSGLL